jgi:glycosyltransferase involved in cell wall biosynthesis
MRSSPASERRIIVSRVLKLQKRPKMPKIPLKIAFIHNYYIHYRVPLYELLAEKYYVTFFFDAIHPYIAKISRKIRSKVAFGVHVGGEVVPFLLWYYLIKDKFDVFVAGDATNLSTIVAFVMSKLLRKPFILWEERWMFIRNTIANLSWPITRLVSLRADAIVVPGSKSKHFYEILGVDKSRIFIAPNASYVEILRYHEKKAQELSEKLQLKDKTVILFLGRVRRLKGVHVLLRAFGRFHGRFDSLYLLIAGEADPKYRRELDCICKELNLANICFVDPVPPKERGTYLKLADIVVYPSITYDAWGLVINEAMSVGKAVISTINCGCACDLIKDKINGYVVPAGDVDALHSSLKRLCEDPELVRGFGQISKRTILEGYTYSHMFKGFVDSLEYVMKR